MCGITKFLVSSISYRCSSAVSSLGYYIDAHIFLFSYGTIINDLTTYVVPVQISIWSPFNVGQSCVAVLGEVS